MFGLAPVKAAVSESTPTGRADVVSVAVPPETVTGEPTFVVPARNCTVPAAVAGVTVAVRVTGTPAVTGDGGETASAVVVVIGWLGSVVWYAVGLVKYMAVVKVPVTVPRNESTHRAVTSYSPATMVVPRSTAASCMFRPKKMVNGLVCEYPAEDVVGVGAGVAAGRGPHLWCGEVGAGRRGQGQGSEGARRRCRLCRPRGEHGRAGHGERCDRRSEQPANDFAISHVKAHFLLRSADRCGAAVGVDAEPVLLDQGLVRTDGRGGADEDGAVRRDRLVFGPD